MTDSSETLTASSPDLSPILPGTLLPAMLLVHSSNPDRTGEAVFLDRSLLVLGRSTPIFPGGPLEDPEVSRQHLGVRVSPEGGVEVEDLGSKNGSFLEGRRLPPGRHLWPQGKCLRLGGTLLIWRYKTPIPPEDGGVPEFLGISDAARQIRRQVLRDAPDTAPLLILGETGTGKEVVADALARLGRPSGPFLAFNSAAVPPTLVDSTLFGHERGAFTGADRAHQGLFRAAHGGTLLLDEVADLPLETQVRLLRVLEDGLVTPLGSTRSIRVDVRVLSATSQDLARRVREGVFRADLYARLAFRTLTLPPLRSRLEDLPVLARRFARGRPFSPLAMEMLLCHPWPFNVRELRALVEAMVAEQPGEGPLVPTEAIWRQMEAHRQMISAEVPEPVPALSRKALEEALRRHRGNMTEVARELGKDRAMLYRYLRKWGLDPDSYRR